MLLGGVAAALAARGDEVVCLQRSQMQAADGVCHVQGDVRDLQAVRAAAEGCAAIVHGAARVGVLGSWEEFRSVNVDGTANVLAAAQAAGVQRLVHVSTPSVAHSGHSLVGVGAEPAVTGRKGAFYAESKAIAERLALAANAPHLAVVAIRPHLVWGPGDTQLVGRIVERAAAGRLVMVGDGSALVDTTYIDNAISALIAALDVVGPSAVCAGRAYVVANGEPRTVRELVEGICLAAGVPFAPRQVPVGVALRVGALVEKLWPRFRDGEPPITRFVAEQLGTAHWFDPRPMHDDIGWAPHVTLDDGFQLLRRSFAVRGA